MLAELFILRLETRLKGPAMSAPISSETRFVAIDRPDTKSVGGRADGGDCLASAREVDNAAIH